MNEPVKAISDPTEPNDLKRRYEMLSHDLRTAVGGVIGNLDQLQSPSLDASELELIKSAKASARMIQSYLEDIQASLEFSEAENLPLQVSVIQTSDMLDSISAQWNTIINSGGFELVFAQSDKVPETLNIDLHRILRIVGNAFQNSMKYASGGSLDFSLDVADGALVIAIGDQGPGFSDGALDLLFTYSGKPRDSDQAGRGLGLYIAKTLVQEMDGQIEARNKKLGGAEVIVTLPGAIPEPKQDAPKDSSMAIMPNAALPDLSGFNVLLAEDNVTNQVVVAQMLEAMGANFVVASDGVEGLAALDNAKFDIALIDIEMPRMSGLDLIRNVRARRDKVATLPLVAFTAYAMREHRYRIAEAGADGLIAKPVKGIEDLGNAILRYLPVKRMPVATASDTPACEDIPGDAVVDLDVFNRLKNSIGDANMTELLIRVQEDLAGVRKKIAMALEEEKFDLAQSASHVLISVAGAIGATSLQHDAQRLNALCHSDNPNSLKTAARECLEGIDKLVGFVQKTSV